MENKQIFTEIPEDIKYLINHDFLSQDFIERESPRAMEMEMEMAMEMEMEMEKNKKIIIDFFTENPYLLNDPVNENNDKLIHKIAFIEYSENFANFLDLMIDNKKINLDVQNNEGNTILHRIICHNREKDVLYYIDKGAKFDIKNNEEKTAKDIFYVSYNLYQKELRKGYPTTYLNNENGDVDKLKEFFDYTIEKAIEEASKLDLNDKKVVERFSLKIKNFFDLEIENLLEKVNDEREVLNDKLKLLKKASDNLFEISMQNNKENFENHGKDNFINNNHMFDE